MQSSCKQSDAFNQRKEDVGNYQSVKVKHITQTHRRNTKGAQRRLDSHPHLQIACVDWSSLDCKEHQQN